MSTLRMVLWPVLIAATISVTRLVCEVVGWVSPVSGGALNPLGISWLGFLFGALFAQRLAKAGSRPRIRPLWPWTLTAFVALAGTVIWQFRPLAEGPPDTAALTDAVTTIIVVTLAITAALLWLWPRLWWTLLCYAVPSRLVVVGLTWLAKRQEWDTHYTKFGPQGLERPMTETVVGASFAQLGFWTPFTIVSGFVLGAFFARRRYASAANSASSQAS